MQVDWLLLFSRWLHVLAAIIAIGGAFFMRAALIPAAKANLDEATHDRLREALRKRWAVVVMSCIAVLLVTGSINFVLLAWPPKIKPMPYHAIFGFKLLAALGVFFIASALVGGSVGLEGVRRNSKTWLTWIVVLAVAIVGISGVLSQVRQEQARNPARVTAPPTHQSEPRP